MVKHMMRMMLVAMVAGALLTSACSSFKKRKAPVAPPAAPPAPTVVAPKPAETPANAPVEGHRPGELVPFPAGAMEVIYFDFDKSTIRKDQLPRIEKDLQYLKAHPEAKAYVEGHTDERGTVEYNFALGMRRAQAVQNYFIKNGIAADRLAVASKGEEQPVDPGHNEAAWAKNRRVEFMQMF